MDRVREWPPKEQKRFYLALDITMVRILGVVSGGSIWTPEDVSYPLMEAVAIFSHNSGASAEDVARIICQHLGVRPEVTLVSRERWEQISFTQGTPIATTMKAIHERLKQVGG